MGSFDLPTGKKVFIVHVTVLALSSGIQTLTTYLFKNACFIVQICKP